MAKGQMQFFQDPGILFAIANGVLLFACNPITFWVIFLALIFSIFLKIYSRSNINPVHPLQKIGCIVGRKPFLGLEITGYACLFAAFINLIQQRFFGFICAFCFGLANLLMADRYMAQHRSSLCWATALRISCKNYSLTPLILAALNDPILLICIGFIHNGLAAGPESLWILPLICCVPYFIICKSKLNRAIPFGCLSICLFWFSIVAFQHNAWVLAFANAVSAIAYVEITLQEHRQFKQSS